MKVRSLLSVGLAAAIAAAIGGSTAHAQLRQAMLKSHNLPPAQRLMEPGPGVDGPGPGVLGPHVPTNYVGPNYGRYGENGGCAGGGGCEGGGGDCDGGAGGGDAGMYTNRPDVQILFVRPEAMQVRWDTTGNANFDGEPLVTPARYNFPQDGIYRLKVTNIGSREGVELYPTLEVGPTTARTDAFLAHNAIPIQFTEEDFDQVLAGNFVTKVIYLPDPEFQELALAGVETLVSTRLDPGVDPITEADRRGSIMAIIRLGNKDIELPGSNGVNAAHASYVDGGDAGCENGDCPDAASSGGCANGRCALGGHGGAGAGAGGPCGPSTIDYSAVGHSGGPPASLPHPYVSGYTVPEYGMVSSGTPIGLPGPPHIPFGGQAGLRYHTIWNHTHEHYPKPNHYMNYHVRHMPGYSYPRPVHNVYIREQNIHPATPNRQPPYYWSERVGQRPWRPGEGYGAPSQSQQWHQELHRQHAQGQY